MTFRSDTMILEPLTKFETDLFQGFGKFVFNETPFLIKLFAIR